MLDLLGPLHAAFPNFPMDEATTALYVSRLQCEDEGDLCLAIADCIDYCRWMPSIGEIKQRIRERRVETTPASPPAADPGPRACGPGDEPLSPEEWRKLLPPRPAREVIREIRRDRERALIPDPAAMIADIRRLRRKLMPADQAQAIEDALDGKCDEEPE